MCTNLLGKRSNLPPIYWLVNVGVFLLAWSCLVAPIDVHSLCPNFEPQPNCLMDFNSNWNPSLLGVGFLVSEESWCRQILSHPSYIIPFSSFFSIPSVLKLGEAELVTSSCIYLWFWFIYKIDIPSSLSSKTSCFPRPIHTRLGCPGAGDIAEILDTIVGMPQGKGVADFVSLKRPNVQKCNT